MRLTKHALQRGKERLGLANEATERLAAKALEFGIPHAEATGRFRKYLDYLRHAYQNGATDVRVYGEKIFLFRGVTLITILHLPNEHKKAAAKLRARREPTEIERTVPCANPPAPSPKSNTI